MATIEDYRGPTSYEEAIAYVTSIQPGELSVNMAVLQSTAYFFARENRSASASLEARARELVDVPGDVAFKAGYLLATKNILERSVECEARAISQISQLTVEEIAGDVATEK